NASFIESTPGIAAELEIHTVTYTFPGADPIQFGSPFFLIQIKPGAYNLTIEPFAAPSALGAQAYMDLYWMLTTDTGAAVPTAKVLSSVPPSLSATQGAGAVSIELKGALHADYDALGVIDTIVAQ